MKPTDEKMAGLCQILLNGIFGICEYMDKEEENLHKKFLAFHIRELQKDFEKIIITFDPFDRMYMENILYNYDLTNFKFNKETLSAPENDIVFERVLRKLRYPKNAKYLEKYVADNWKDYVNKNFD